MIYKQKNIFRFTLGLLLSWGALTPIQAQTPKSTIAEFDSTYLNWYNLSPELDKVEGVEVNRAYSELLKNKKSKKTIVVAVIDSGVDINHPDLKGHIWTNPKEVAGNRKDDDKNGYVDDVHGWGLLGNAKGQNVNDETYEFVRILKKLKPKYDYVSSIDQVSDNKMEEYNLYVRAKQAYEEEFAERQQTQESLDEFEKVLNSCNAILSEYLKKDKFTLAEVEKIDTSDKRVMAAKGWFLEMSSKGFTPEDFQEAKKQNEEFLTTQLNLDINPRKIVGDNPEDIKDKRYGNNNVIGPRADHGTAVAGIIAALRNNKLGIDGIASNVKIMAVRAVPNGDERDKDIALAIRYAVDKGANIINMSFGKDFSPQKQFVDDAVKYAQQKNVLLVHAAGNDASNIDVVPNYPTKETLDSTIINTWIEVGATSKSKNVDFVGDFSNYGQKNVDLFAPGVDIISLAPGKKYLQADGTSFASPVVSGVAALVWSYYPELTARELKEVLLKSSTTYPSLKVNLPSENPEKRKKVEFSTLSNTGGVINAYKAIQLAEKTVSDKATKI